MAEFKYLYLGLMPHAELGTLPPNVTVLRSGPAREPCWFKPVYS